MEFYVQITMGVRINDILSFLHVMIDEFKKIKNANAKEKIYCDIIPEIELDLSQRIGDSVMRNIKLCTIYVLFIYIRKTRDNRKKYPFFIRHNTSSLLKLLTEHEFSILLSWIHSETDKNFAMQSRIRESRQDIWKKYFGSQRSNKFNELKEFQQNKYSSCYSILNQSKMIVLIECRYFNQILNYHINPSRNLFQYISLQDLKKIKYQKKDFPILFYHLDEVPEISKLFL
jgi:hypothetical protein